jgi:hypothetical protein
MLWQLGRELDSFGKCPGTVQILEYDERRCARPGDATHQPLQDAVRTVTAFYRNKLEQQGWEELQSHAAIEGYVKQDQEFWILRYGPDDADLPPELDS